MRHQTRGRRRVPSVDGRKPLPSRRGHHAGYRPGHQQNAVAHAHPKYQRYVALAREAGLKGDAVAAENFFQHAEHFYRVLRDAQR